MYDNKAIYIYDILNDILYLYMIVIYLYNSYSSNNTSCNDTLHHSR